MTTALNTVPSNAAETAPVSDFERIMAAVEEAANMLQATSEKSESLGELAPEVFEWMREQRLSMLIIPKDLGGYGVSPTQALTIWEKISYHQAAAGWVGFIHGGAAAMCVGYLDKAGTDILFDPDANNIICGAGAPTGVAEKVPGGYRITGRWSYGSGITFADYAHTGAILHIDGEPQYDDQGRPIVLCVHPTTEEMVNEGNWDVLGLQGTGSIDYSFKDVFCPEELAYDFGANIPIRDFGFFQIGPVGIAAMGHPAVAIALSRRIMDEAAAFARSKSNRSQMAGTSDAFWEEFARMDARVRASRAFLFETWRQVEQHIIDDTKMPTRLHTLIRMASIEVHDTAAEAAQFAYRACGGAALRDGTIQRLFREVYVAVQHLTVSPAMVRTCGRELMDAAPDKVWRMYDLADPG